MCLEFFLACQSGRHTKPLTVHERNENESPLHKSNEAAQKGRATDNPVQPALPPHRRLTRRYEQVTGASRDGNAFYLPAADHHLDISEQLYQACSEYWKPQRSVVTDYVVVEVPQGRVHTDSESSVAVISRSNRVVTNVSLSLRDGKVCDDSQNNIFSQRYFSEPHRLKGTVFTMLSGGAGVNNIGHWFLDVLPRLHLLEQSGLLAEVDWFLVPSTRYQTETLSMLGIPSNKIVSSEEHSHVAADCVIASTAPRGRHTLVPRWLLDYMRDAFLIHGEREQESSGTTSPGSCLYISRRDSSIRNVLNEEELQGVLAHYGFRTIVSSGYSIVDKIRLFSKARFVMSPTGAGLISILFCQPGTRLVEIFTRAL